MQISKKAESNAVSFLSNNLSMYLDYLIMFVLVRIYIYIYT